MRYVIHTKDGVEIFKAVWNGEITMDLPRDYGVDMVIVNEPDPPKPIDAQALDVAAQQRVRRDHEVGVGHVLGLRGRRDRQDLLTDEDHRTGGDLGGAGDADVDPVERALVADDELAHAGLDGVELLIDYRQVLIGVSAPELFASWHKNRNPPGARRRYSVEDSIVDPSLHRRLCRY